MVPLCQCTTSLPIVSWRVQTLVGKGTGNAKRVPAGIDTALKKRSLGLRFMVTKRALPQAGLLPQVDNDAVLPVHNVVAVVSWR